MCVSKLVFLFMVLENSSYIDSTCWLVNIHTKSQTLPHGRFVIVEGFGTYEDECIYCPRRSEEIIEVVDVVVVDVLFIVRDCPRI